MSIPSAFRPATRASTVEEDKHHSYLATSMRLWAENHYVGVEAEDDDQARAKLERLYPGDVGFVIGEIRQMASEE